MLPVTTSSGMWIAPPQTTPMRFSALAFVFFVGLWGWLNTYIDTCIYIIYIYIYIYREIYMYTCTLFGMMWRNIYIYIINTIQYPTKLCWNVFDVRIGAQSWEVPRWGHAKSAATTETPPEKIGRVWCNGKHGDKQNPGLGFVSPK